MSLGLKRGSLIKHEKHGLCYVGGTSKGKITLHDVVTSKRIGRSFLVKDCKFLSYSSWSFILKKEMAII